MTFYELKNKVETKGGESFFFNPDTLKFFGERLSDMRLLKTKAIITDCMDNKHTCYIVSAIRRKNAFGHCRPYTHHHYFDIETFHHVTPKTK